MKHSVTMLSNQSPEKGTKTLKENKALQARQSNNCHTVTCMNKCNSFVWYKETETFTNQQMSLSNTHAWMKRIAFIRKIRKICFGAHIYMLYFLDPRFIKNKMCARTAEEWRIVNAQRDNYKFYGQTWFVFFLNMEQLNHISLSF